MEDNFSDYETHLPEHLSSTEEMTMQKYGGSTQEIETTKSKDGLVELLDKLQIQGTHENIPLTNIGNPNVDRQLKPILRSDISTKKKCKQHKIFLKFT